MEAQDNFESQLIENVNIAIRKRRALMQVHRVFAESPELCGRFEAFALRQGLSHVEIRAMTGQLVMTGQHVATR